MNRRSVVCVLVLAACSATLDAPPPEAPAIAVAVAPQSVTFRAGTTSPIVQVVLSRNTTATQAVQLSLTGLPTGVRATLTPSNMALSDRTATLELLATATAPAGTSLVTIKAESGTLSVTSQLSVTVQPPS
ncbi:MAG: hypothetical protein IPK85_18695 [Gemmatimonadetes bacterium]|nr:hypothetical protein [Gemmatimonadota bacterium]